MTVLSVDLAFRRWSDLGIVLLERGAAPGNPIQCEILPWLGSGPDSGPDPGPVDPNILAGRLHHLCGQRGVRVLMLDGPQAWKSRSNGLKHCRASERALNTSAKTGLPGIVKPVTYRSFAEFCIDVYDGLCRRGWRRLTSMPEPSVAHENLLVESYPHAAWKSLGLAPLPSKRLCRVSDLAKAYGALRSLIPFTTNRPPNHDQLQAIVGGLSGLALEARNAAATRIVGEPPRREEGHWREGFIVLPLPPTQPLSLRWLD